MRSPGRPSRIAVALAAGSRLHRRILAALSAPPRPPTRPGWRTTPRPPATRRRSCAYAPQAAERAATLGAHREAAAQFARALRFADALARDRARRAARAALVRVLPDRARSRPPSTPGAERWRSTGAGRPPARGRRPPLALAPALVQRRDDAPRESGSRCSRSSCSSRCRRAVSWRWPTATCPSCACWPATGRARCLGRAGDRARRAARRERDPGARAQQRRHRRARERCGRGRRVQLRAQPGAGARGGLRGACRPRLYEPRGGGRASCTSTRWPILLWRRDRLLPRARPRLVAAVHERLEGSRRSSSRAAGTPPQDVAATVARPPGRPADEPDHAAGRARPTAGAARRPGRAGGRSTRRSCWPAHRRAAAPGPGGRRPGRGAGGSPGKTARWPARPRWRWPWRWPRPMPGSPVSWRPGGAGRGCRAGRAGVQIAEPYRLQRQGGLAGCRPPVGRTGMSL